MTVRTAERDPAPMWRTGSQLHLDAVPGRLPSWPLGALLGGYPLWWALGIADFSWILFAFVMAAYLVARGSVRVPRGFGMWLLFLLWVGLSATQLLSVGDLSFFGYRALQNLSATVLFIYVYNARESITDRYLTGAASLLWVTTIIGGYLGMLLPSVVYRSPLSFVLPQALLGNDLINRMVIRRFSQFNADSWVEVAPRPSAPYLYTNNWGNAYALLLPLVLIYLFESRGTRRFWWVLASIPISLIPAISTMNRGMFIGVGVAVVYIGVRYLLMGKPFVAIACAAAIAIAAIVLVTSPVNAELQDRLDSSGTNESRSTVYLETLQDVAQSPLLGMGTPRANENPKLPPVGSHGQFWIVMHSHGVPAMIFFVGWFVSVYFKGVRRTDFTGIASGAVVLVSLVQFTFYGFVPVGMALLMAACALTLRGPTAALEVRPPSPARASGARLGLRGA